jgi:2-dehydropantoate 2-reductase
VRICILGAGSIGGILGARLAQAGHAVSLLARGDHLAAIRAEGLGIRDIGADSGDVRRFRLPAADDPAAFGPQDAVVVALKAYSIGPMLARLAPLLTPDTAVVTAINGIPWWYFARAGGRFDGAAVECLDPDGAMLRALDPKHLVGCVVHASAEVTAPGVVHHTSGRVFILGELDGAMSPRLAALGAAIAAAGLEARLSPRIRDDVWTKLIGNTSFNPVAALTGALMNEINANPPLLALIRRMMVEAMAVAEALGAKVTVTIDERLAISRSLGAAKISMHQDIERGRPLEIDAIVAAVSELGRKVGVATPTIDGVEALIRERARHRWVPVDG